ncbi:hypothetical protein Thal_1112 [Thermocrinis albus DSM 14484]|uniref:Uncharacterized protein n=1 Tax=Thermocrinis albus (strain DSM 14484 / JCM 11386 / HI 11/12) TaxID=638303 RepID=D3SLW4_THEAH|nr:hypothetical protein [Thermocrinis albus]ADC89744.1 hypothetical protein Thal_1112 [Thermocrinis albus DSM 14484]
MAIRVLEKVSVEGLIKELTLRGWKEGKFNGKQAMFKEFENYLWVAVIEEYPYFLSLPKEESSKVHSEGMKKLIEEVSQLATQLNFSLPVKPGGGYHV